MGKNKSQYDNPTWLELKYKMNNTHDPNKLRLYIDEWNCNELPYTNVLVKLGYIKPIVVLTSTNYILHGYYTRLKEIPNELKWIDAKELSKQCRKKLNKGKRPYTKWTTVVDHINKQELGHFNKYDSLERYSSSSYYNMFARLGYLEKLDRKGNYNILQKIPENLSSSTVNKMLYDNIYKRQVKILKLKEKLANDITRDI